MNIYLVLIMIPLTILASTVLLAVISKLLDSIVKLMLAIVPLVTGIVIIGVFVAIAFNLATGVEPFSGVLGGWLYIVSQLGA
jgi:hypothetical protein